MDDRLLALLSQKDLSSVPFDQLLALRQAAPSSEQQRIAPYEHRAYARETVQSDPLAALSMAINIPAYQLAKLLRLVPSDERSTPASFDQLIEGYKGILEGLRK